MDATMIIAMSCSSGTVDNTLVIDVTGDCNSIKAGVGAEASKTEISGVWHRCLP